MFGARMSESRTMPANQDQPSSFQRFVERLAGVVIGIAAVALIGLVAVQGWQVIARYVLNDSPSWTEPVTVLLLTTAMSFGAAAGVHTRRHFNFSLLADALEPGPRRALRSLTPLTVVAIGAVIAYWGAVLFVDGLDILAAGAPLPQSINYLPLAIGGALMALFGLDQVRHLDDSAHVAEEA
jgi:TRAP-type C4-dicarboxylate transport system permease small subunit